ncbi:MAG: ATP-dependent DNA helicase DinG [Proteobacteria bacterium]|nr:ATP-dependent DNA helicase DinG [Pseudomonadota bacterium]
MLDDTLKAEIQTAYTALLAGKGYTPRRCQKTMIADIARSLSAIEEDAGQICVLEAGTGTGKTIAYTLAAIPIAQRLKKKVVIATATVALQEQIMFRDLPDIRTHSGLDFSFALAKGRRRYLCLARLDGALQGPSAHPVDDLFGDSSAAVTGADQGPVFEQMITKLGHGEWDGDRDAWPTEIDDIVWSRVSTDHAQCTGRRCTHFENCYFYRARESIHRVECIVTNQDLVLSDLMMGGGAVLPDPEETIYIFDEAHHLPDKAGNHFSGFLSLYATRSWLLQLPASLRIAQGEVPMLSPQVIAAFEETVTIVTERMEEIARSLMPLQEHADVVDEGWRYRFPMGVVDDPIAALSASLASGFQKLVGYAETMVDLVEQAMEDTTAGEREVLEHWLSNLSSAAARLGAAWKLWDNYARPMLEPPFARWVKFSSQGQVEGMELQMSCHPISVADQLQETLWSRCAGAVLTSATISVGGDFSTFQQRTGIGSDQLFNSLPSPFRFREQATLRVPAMDSDPSDPDGHTEELATRLPEILRDEPGSLVLFTSWRQMLRVHDEIEPQFRERVLMQGDLSKMEMLATHKKRIDAGQSSCIFGLASFAEGVDLPGGYCTHVVIAKLPFSVPDDPVDATLSEWIVERGGNAFYDLMLPNAILRVVQGAGRLMRTESDVGTVTILDRRLVSKAYGRRILDALPPFSREIS